MKIITTALLLSGLNIFWLSAQTVTTITTSASKIDDDIIFDSAGNLYGSNYVGAKVYKRSVDGTESVFVSGLGSPNGMAFNDDGTLVLADNTGNKIYKVFPDGTKEVLVASIGGPSGILRMENSDTMLVTSYTGHKIWKLAPNGTMTSFLTHPEFNGPVGLCYDDNHNLYIANFGDRKIFKVSPGGQPVFLAQPPLGSNIGFIAYAKQFLYATSFGGHIIYKIDLNGNYVAWLGSTIGSTDGDASVAKFNRPNGIRASRTGDTLYVSDFGTKRVRMITNLDGVSSANNMEVSDWNFTVSPNPVSENAQVSFELPKAAQISIGIYHTQGVLLRTVLPATHLPEGRHELPLMSHDLPKGLYFIQIQSSEGGQMVQKFVVD